MSFTYQLFYKVYSFDKYIPFGDLSLGDMFFFSGLRDHPFVKDGQNSSRSLYSPEVATPTGEEQPVHRLVFDRSPDLEEQFQTSMPPLSFEQFKDLWGDELGEWTLKNETTEQDRILFSGETRLEGGGFCKISYECCVTISPTPEENYWYTDPNWYVRFHSVLPGTQIDSYPLKIDLQGCGDTCCRALLDALSSIPDTGSDRWLDY